MNLARLDRTLFFAATSGVLLAAAFPRPNLFWLAWVALVPLLLVMRRRPFAAGFTAGGVFFAIVLYWLNFVMITYGGLSFPFAVLAYLFLVVYLASYIGLATWLSSRLEVTFKLPFLLTLPFIWVALEYLRGVMFTGFPWALIGYSQQDFSLAIQSCDVTGVYGVSFILIVVNCAVAGMIAAPKSRLAWLGAVVALGISISHFGYGFWRESQPLDEQTDHLRVSLIQGNIDQMQKWDPEYRQTSIDIYHDLSLLALENRPELVIWPEAATPFYLQDRSQFATQVRKLPPKLNAFLLVGSPAYEQLAADNYRYFNSAYLFSPSGLEMGRSDKRHLVPFGEYVPLGDLLGFVDKLVVGVGDFSSGQVRSLPLDGHALGVLICYEAIFPQLARDYIRNGSDLLVNLTNDAWFGRTSAPYQLLAMTRFRAIENRVWIARAANTGVSALIAPSGNVVISGPIFEALELTGSVGLGAGETFYTRFGDLFAYICIGISAVFLFALLLAKKWQKFPLVCRERSLL
ncbi:apolipoprotein N-acyltransferase [Desulfuromusa kysingii]|uniref:Apolipoprotein N-acyltransferase n=1 Tax=Desulfuromusa kysingii TaxID=37625 RepID=A0A1H3ZP17_9BACT|nr:apolipoprotein N-acyltransferase [Desulfuromusa kysingii]SEA25516.1 apolipoprotein N-acyltransferase [Desulfuromusa kysingii]